MPDFTFIDHSVPTINKESRRAIRSHVMRGRNTGKTKKPQTRPLPKASTVINLPPLLRIAKKRSNVPSDSKVTPEILIQIGDALSGLSWAGTFAGQQRKIFFQFMDYVSEALYPREFCEPMNVVSTLWFHYMLVDETYFHCFLALSAACVDFATGTDEASSPLTKQHYAKAVRLVNQKLSGNQACADTAIAGVISLCILAGLREDNHQAKLHFDGLCKMIHLRGGMESLAYNFPLVEKIHRIDIDIALHFDLPTRFDSSTLGLLFPEQMKVEASVSSIYANLLSQIDTETAVLARDILDLTSTFNACVTGTKIEALAFQDITSLYFYRMIKIRTSPGWEMKDRLSQAVLVGLTAMMTTLLFQVGRNRRIWYAPLANSFHEILGDASLLSCVEDETHLWLLIIAGLSTALMDKDVQWLTLQLSKTLAQLEIEDWPGVHTTLSQFPWVGAVENKAAQSLVQRVLGERSILPHDQ